MSFLPRMLSLVNSAKSMQASMQRVKESASTMKSMAHDAQQAAVSREWQKACQGDLEAQSDLGDRLCEGRGVPRNYEVAIEWFRLSAEGGYAPAQCKLGMMLFLGRGAPADRVEAYKWLLLAARQGHAEAVTALKTAAQKMPPEEVAEGKLRASQLRPEGQRRSGEDSAAKPEAG
jgi:TPR repeat protein